MFVHSSHLNQSTDAVLKQNESCAYCGMSEFDLCSPLVIGQCRDEHEAYLNFFRPKRVICDFDDSESSSLRKPLLVKFLINGRIEMPSALEMPFFPALRDTCSDAIFAMSNLLAREIPLVHEHCAFQMFQARLDGGRSVSVSSFSSTFL
jgi:hypothetical protein